MDEKKCVIVLDEDLPVGLLTNSAAVFSLTLGKEIDGIIDRDITDGSGEVHRGITNTVLLILKTRKEHLTGIQGKPLQNEEILMVNFSDT